ncbi:MAG: TRAP transporter permease [Deltaproteobacteria bacterium]|jgi:TRAP transporter 4TM/12TM fusion protein|nr:TRAP transporter permease [Deltaproteobacteria bacterium]
MVEARELGGSQKARRVLAFALGLSLALFHLYSSGIGLLPTEIQRPVHLALALSLIFFLYPLASRKWAFPLDVMLAILSLVGAGYIAVAHEAIAFRGGRPLAFELVLGFMTMVLVLEAGRRVLGPILPILAIIFILYCYFGRLAPGFFQHRGVSINRLIQHMYLTHEGLFGVALGVSSTYIFMFILFGAVLSQGGGVRFFNNLAQALTGRLTGGPAKVAVIASGLMGTINGSSVANVATTGAVTIPLMKKAGFDPEEAGAIEACASTGGQIMPPIMGAGAFIMSEFLGISYLSIAIAAVFPAILYFLSIFASVHFISQKKGLKGQGTGARIKEVLFADGHLALPLIIMVGMLLASYTPLKASFVAIIALWLVGLTRKNTRLGPKSLATAFVTGAKGGALTAMACATVGFLVGTFSLTGLGLSLSTHLLALTKGLLFPTLGLAMLACLVMGMGLPTTANYIVCSAVIGPALVKLGVWPLGAHLFLFYFGLLADITPPVCLASITAAGLASASAAKTGLKAFILSWPSFVLPYLFIYSPEIIWQKGGFLDITGVVGSAALGVISWSAGLNGFFQGDLPKPLRFLALLTGLALFWPEGTIKMFGVVGFGLFWLARHLRSQRTLKLAF